MSRLEWVPDLSSPWSDLFSLFSILAELGIITIEADGTSSTPVFILQLTPESAYLGCPYSHCPLLELLDDNHEHKLS